ncbi:hypothetical protein BASA81_003620 [Batrachochytrium salamandrivorans]|nr:hypothetical protein BASA81_003620 [Batrachochytrium salamandrivorans]
MDIVRPLVAVVVLGSAAVVVYSMLNSSKRPLVVATVEASEPNLDEVEEEAICAESLLDLEALIDLVRAQSVGFVLAGGRLLLLRGLPNELTKQRIKFILSVVRLGRAALERDARQLPGQILGRVLPPFNSTTEHFVQQAIKWAEAHQALGVFLPVGFGAHSGLQLAGGAEVATVALESDCNALLLLPSTNGMVFVGCENNTTVALDLQGSVQFTLEGFHTDQITALAHFQGKWVVSGSADGKIGLWNLQGEFVRALEQGGSHTARVTGLYVMDNLLYSGSHDKTIRVWDLVACCCINVLAVDEDWVTSIAAVGDHVFCATDVGTLHAWKSLCDLITVSDAHDSDVCCMVTTRTHLFTGSWDETAKMWTLELHPMRTFLGHSDWVTAIAVQDGTLFTGSRDCQIRVWDLQVEESSPRVLLGHTTIVSGLQVHGELLYSASSHLRTFEWNNSICFPEPELGHQLEVLCVVATWDLAVCMTGSKDTNILIWDMLDPSTRNAAGLLEGHEGWVNCLALCKENDELLVSGSGDKTVRVWDWNNTGDCLFVLHGHSHWVISIQVFNSPQVWCETVDYAGEKICWDLGTRKQVPRPDTEQERATNDEEGENFHAQISFTRDVPETEEDVVDFAKITHCPTRKLILAPKAKAFEAWQVFRH